METPVAGTAIQETAEERERNAKRELLWTTEIVPLRDKRKREKQMEFAKNLRLKASQNGQSWVREEIGKYEKEVERRLSTREGTIWWLMNNFYANLPGGMNGVGGAYYFPGIMLPGGRSNDGFLKDIGDVIVSLCYEEICNEMRARIGSRDAMNEDDAWVVAEIWLEMLKLDRDPPYTVEELWL